MTNRSFVLFVVVQKLVLKHLVSKKVSFWNRHWVQGIKNILNDTQHSTNLHNPVLEELHSDVPDEHSHLLGPGNSFTAAVVVSHVNAAQTK